MFQIKNPSKNEENPTKNMRHPCFEFTFRFSLMSIIVRVKTNNPKAPSWKYGFLTEKKLIAINILKKNVVDGEDDFGGTF